MVDLPSTTLGTAVIAVNGTERTTGRRIEQSIVGLAGQTFNGTQRKLLKTY
jgi:hypothetical protein